MTALSPRQRALARQALGFPNARNKSFRNRFLASYRAGDYDHWLRLVDEGLADHGPIIKGMVRFWLTRKGAEAALEAG
ncbi:hypothetical protein [Pararhodobacter sp.]|uniref:hypothetical protein n=1 Tax=Pararhodobacter sp. TaxID=2127056 RepID=UPI002FDDBC70